MLITVVVVAVDLALVSVVVIVSQSDVISVGNAPVTPTDADTVVNPLLEIL